MKHHNLQQPDFENQYGTIGADRNTYLGTLAGGTNQKGSDNIMIGWHADFGGVGTAITNNSNNIVIGNNAILTTDDINNATVIGDSAQGLGNSIALGANAKSNGTNSIAIGFQTQVIANNEAFIGNTSTVSIGGAVNWTATSDGRFKKDIEENVPGLSFISKLKPVTYKFDIDKISSFNQQENVNPQRGATTYTGFIAQDVETAAKESNYDFSGIKVPTDKNKEMYGIRYAEFVPSLVKAVQELNQKVNTLEQQNITKSEALKSNQEVIALLKKQVKLLQVQNQMLALKEQKTISNLTAKK